jgi:hypothetical protein
VSPNQLDEVVGTNVWKDSDEIDRKDIQNCVEVFGRDVFSMCLVINRLQDAWSYDASEQYLHPALAV